MPQCCAVPMCFNRIGGHRFPRDKRRLEQWLIAIRRDHFTPTINSLVCKYHFTKHDYEKPKDSVLQNPRLILKKNAVPSIFPWSDENDKSQFNRGSKQHWSDTNTETFKDNVAIRNPLEETEQAETENTMECRACLAEIEGASCSVDLFSAWNTRWPGMGLSMAEDLARIAGIEISMSDAYSKIICRICCDRLQDAVSFTHSVQNSDIVLRRRQMDTSDDRHEWPQPIQENVTNDQEMEVEIKQEVFTEDEYDMSNNYDTKGDLDALDIKIEPEEMIQPSTDHLEFEISSPVSLSQPRILTSEEEQQKALINGEPESTEYLEQEVKEEPLSEGETDAETLPDIQKDCMLCMKTFRTFRGLKAHVLSAHSYETVVKPTKISENFECPVCNMFCETKSELTKHQKCHISTCEDCGKTFDSGPILAMHRLRLCKKMSPAPILDDVRKIAGHRGTKTLELFDLHIPIAKITDLKIDENASLVEHKQEDTRRVTQKGSKENDILRNILNNNVTSVVVNVRLPIDCFVNPKNELLDDEDIFKQEPIDYNIDNVVPKQEYLIKSENDEPTMNDSNHNDLANSPSDDIALDYQLGGIPISRTKVFAVPIDETKLDLVKYLRKLKRKKRKRKLRNPLANKGKPVQRGNQAIDESRNEANIKMKQLKRAGIGFAMKEGRVVPTKKVDALYSCRKRCAYNIPQEFRQRFFDHYWTLNRKLQMKMIPKLIECKLLDPFNVVKSHCQRERKCTFSYCLKLGNECYDICKGCFIQTLGVNSTLNTICRKILKMKLKDGDQ